MSSLHSSPPPAPRSGVYLPPAHARPASPATRFELPAPKPRQHHGIPEILGFGWSVLCGLPALVAMLAGANVIATWLVMFFVWVGPAFLLLIIYLIARAGRRRCPVCGNHVTPGLTRCGACGHDFAAAAHLPR
jgi:hypothetical protein